ncbi:MAG: C25 family cysteine peptidase [Candidatus Bathyarchaeota archaeon]|nr:C25 family cysteine peptidase [Candidatus Bathyarchaeota archaeon]
MPKETFFLGLVLVFILTPQLALSLPENAAAAMSITSEKPLVCILVNSTIYADIEFSLNRYAVDVENSGFAVKIMETGQLFDETPEGIRSYLQENLPHKLDGCLLVGDIPGALFEVGAKEFPTDLYYMDLDGLWTDSDNDMIYDEHSGDVAPEIWVGRLKVPDVAGDEASLLNDYFDKNHRYRIGTLTLPWWRGMIYIDDAGTNTNTENDAKSSLNKIYSDIVFVKDRATTNATDYKKRIDDQLGYQWMYLMCHGTYNNHTFMVPSEEPETSNESWFRWDGTVYSSDYRSINPRIFFYHLVVCSAALYSEPDYLAGSAVFGNDYGLLAVGSTETVSTLPVSGFYGSLSEGKCIGNAFREWSVELHERYDYLQRQFYGLTLIGDPTLRLYHEVHDVAVTDITFSLTNVSGEDTLTVEVAVENQGNFNETFEVTIYYDFTVFDSTDVTLPAEAEATLTFSFTRLDQLILGYHAVEAKASIAQGELDTDDNSLLRTVQGRIVNLPVYPRNTFLSSVLNVMAALSVFIGFGLFTLFFLKILMSERLPSLSSILRRLK